MSSGRRLTVASGAGLALAAGLLLSCSDEVVPARPRPQPRGGVQGQIKVLGRGVPAELTFSSIQPAPDFELRTDTDSAGRFDVPLARGDYRLEVDLSGSLDHSCLIWFSGPEARAAGRPDTLRVREDGTVVNADLDLGAVAVRLAVAPELRGVAMWVGLRGATGWSGGACSSVWTAPDDSLEVTIPAVLPGLYCVQITPDGMDAWYVPGASDLADADTVRVEDGTMAICTGWLVPPQSPDEGTLRGTIRGAWQEMGLAPPTVDAFADSGRYVESVEAAADGSFALRIPGPREVRLRLGWWSNEHWVGGATYEEATAYAVIPGEETLVEPITECGLRVRFDDPGPGCDRWLYIDFVDAVTGGIHESWLLSTAGDYAQNGLVPAGSWNLRVRPVQPGQVCWLEQWYDRAATPDEAAVVTLAGGEVASLTLHLEEGGRVLGRVLGWSEWSRICLLVTPADRDTCWAEDLRLDWQGGRFVIEGLPDGAYKIAAGPDLHSCRIPLPAGNVWYGGTASWDSAAVVTIAGHGTVEGIEIVLPEERAGVHPPEKGSGTHQSVNRNRIHPPQAAP